MSAVLLVCANNFAIMMSDGRMVEFKDGKPYGTVSESTKKIYRVSNNVLLGYAGDYSASAQIVNHLKTLNTYKMTVQDVAIKILDFIPEVKPSYLPINLMLTGKNSAGQFGINTLHS